MSTDPVNKEEVSQEKAPPMPRWVKIVGIFFIIFILLFIILHLTGNGLGMHKVHASQIEVQ
ncbi:hypothetical protein [Paenibacillus sp. OV219]|uniref:hypothetical protein n=1 Tax=Paenibacillus sp. OV219 TaxID=1884377 RepID=UPI0008ACF9AA|nr:hypothetical protein [Paenibacillus sp. OV219]SEP15634.1 hypothetical protein SAMN05518847_12114 [Paenibacillus sp. OV219]